MKKSSLKLFLITGTIIFLNLAHANDVCLVSVNHETLSARISCNNFQTDVNRITQNSIKIAGSREASYTAGSLFGSLLTQGFKNVSSSATAYYVIYVFTK
jgi:hypothetical protein